MSAPIEREIKLRFDTPELARAAVERTGATPLRDRRFQEDCLLDSAEETLRRQRSVLRVRNEGHRSILTFKGPVQPGLMKVREELETVVNDGNLMLQVLERLGLHIWFRYQKYREEYDLNLGEAGDGSLHVALDETPIGAYAELEGRQEDIRRAADALGFCETDFIPDSYYWLYVEFCRERGKDPVNMIFSDSAETAEGKDNS